MISPTPPALRPLLSCEQVAALLGVSRWSVRSWRARGEGPPAIKVGRLVRFDPEALRRWIAEREER